MLALIYLILAVYLGDQLCRRFYRFVFAPHRWAAAFLVGLYFSSWITYLLAWTFMGASKPLLWADLVFFALAIPAVVFFEARARRGLKHEPTWIEPRPSGSEKLDWVTLAIFGVLACWMAFATFNFKSPVLQIANNEFSDFGPNTAIARSFSVGHNFPTQYPHFSGEPIRYHFLFYFQAGNLEFLDFNLAWSINILSILSLLSMLSLVMAMGQLLFKSRAVGRIAATLFFFHGSLNFIPFFRSQHSWAEAWNAIYHLVGFLPSGYPYRGETWGIWSQVVFINQRHLASGIGLLLIVLLFLIDQYYRRQAERRVLANAPIGEEPAILPATEPAAVESATSPVTELAAVESAPVPQVTGGSLWQTLRNFVVTNKSYIFCGVILGGLPFWNAFVFTAALVVLFCFLVLFPNRLPMLALAATAAIVAFPQIFYLRSGGASSTTPRLFHWGYVIDNPTIGNVLRYVGWTFGAKWLLIALALVLVSWFHRRIFIALCSLFFLTFCFQFSIEALASHKFLTLWLIIANVFIAYAFWWLWHVKIKGYTIGTRTLAVLLAVPIFVGGAIDFFPIHNAFYVEINYTKDELTDWLNANTKPHDIFLSDRFVSHQILLAGHRIFYGWPSFAWGAGYDTTKRDNVYRELFESKDPRRVFALLKENHIAYVAIDAGVRHGEFIRHANEQVYARNFPLVYEDKQNKYASLKIYKIPEKAPARWVLVPRETSGGVSMLVGGKGIENGEFDFPRGMTIDPAGNFLVSDTGNGRIEKFSNAGAFIQSFGSMGSGPGDLTAPDGLAVDASNNIYVADTGNQRVQKLRGDGTFLQEWKGPPPGFYGPRDVCAAKDGSIYVVDQGRSRMVKFNSMGIVLAQWGTSGNGDGQFGEPTGVAVDTENDRVYVADPRNQRIQVFDTNGKFITKWPVAEWQPNAWIFQHLVVDSKRKNIYASSLATNEVLVFDFQGNKTGSLKSPSGTLEGASAMVLSNDTLYVLCSFGNRVVKINLATALPH